MNTATALGWLKNVRQVIPMMFFWGGMSASAIGGLIYVKPSWNISGFTPLAWFLVAIMSLTGATYWLSTRFRLTASVAALVCIIASGVIVRERFARGQVWQYEPRARKFTAPLDSLDLAIGAIAPEIQGNDLYGQPMRLSRHRGKVVLLVFWASWCGPCMNAVAHEKELVERFAGRPFVIVGVNGDSSTAQALAAVEKHSIPWDSFWNGEVGANDLIMAAWGVHILPTVYAIDDNGVIRHKNLHGIELDEHLERMITTAETRGEHK
jgi:thiol-disulfide isomerase/thioredoxin